MNGRTNSNNNSTMTILGDGIPLDPPSSFLCEARNSKVDITWVDPKDKYATPEGEQMEDTDQLVSVWSYTKIVRKEGSQPTSPSDGVTVCTNTTRNQYQSTIFEDTGVTNGVTYYYAAYAYNTAGTYSDGAFSDGITPIEWDPVLANNSWEQIDSACTQGVAQSIWNVGDEKDISVNSETQTVVILGFNMDYLASGSKTAAITFGSKNLLKDTYTWKYQLFRGMESTYQSFYTSIDSSIRKFIKKVKIYATDVRINNTVISGNMFSMTGYLFAYTRKRIDGFTGYDDELGGDASESVTYADIQQYPYYATQSNRVKKLENGLGSVESYGLYDYFKSNGSITYPCINKSGVWSDYMKNNGAYGSAGASFAFCVGQSPS